MDNEGLQSYMSFGFLNFWRYRFPQTSGILLQVPVPTWMTTSNNPSSWFFHIQRQLRRSNTTNSSTSRKFIWRRVITPYPTLCQYLMTLTLEILCSIQFCMLLLDAVLRFRFLAAIITLVAIGIIIYTIYTTFSSRQTNNWDSCENLLLSFILFCYSYLAFFGQKVYTNLYTDIFLPLFLNDYIWSVIFIIMTAIYLKLNCVYTKLLLVKSMADQGPIESVHKYLHLVEQLLHLYGCVLLLAPWFCFFNCLFSNSKLLFLCSLGPYIYFKLKSISKICFDLQMAYHGFMNNFMFGIPPTCKEILDSAMTCPICYGNFRVPVKLKCKHIFCRDCVSSWISKQKTCPLCRIKVEKIIPQFNLGGRFIQWY